MIMGNSAQQHRMSIGLHAGHLVASSWSPTSRSRSRKKEQSRKNIKIALTTMTITLMISMGMKNIFIDPTVLPTSCLLTGNISHSDSQVAAQVTRMLLLVVVMLSYTLALRQTLS